MEKQLNKSLKIKLLLICCLALFWQCQDDFEEENVNTHDLNTVNQSNVSYRMLTGIEAKNKAELLNSKINSNFNLDSGIAYRAGSNTNGTIDYDNILEVIDTSGIANYTFKIDNHPEDSESVFHNLVLSDDGTEQKVTLIKYEYENNATKIENFEGKITARNFSNEEPCEETNIDANLNTGTFNPTGGGSAGSVIPTGPGGTINIPDPGNNSGGGSGGGSGFLSVSDQPASFNCNICNYSASSWDSYISSHTDRLGNVYPFTMIINFGRMADLNPEPNPCDGDGTIGVIDDDECISSEAITSLTAALSLTPDQVTCLEDQGDCESTNAINNFINANPEETEFAQLAVIAICETNDINNWQDFIIEDAINNIDDSELNDCHKNILDSLKTLNETNFKKIFKRFMGTDNPKSPYKLKYKSDSLAFNVRGGAFWRLDNGYAVPYNYSILINNSPSIATDLGIASTMLHETVHAYFYSLADDFLQTGDETLENNFPLLWDFYKEHKYTGTSDEQGIPHHETLALLYVDIIASALQEWHTGTIVTNSNQILQLYKDLAWGGLKGTKPFINESESPNLPNANDRIRIDNRLWTEALNATFGAGNTETTPQGTTPCD